MANGLLSSAKDALKKGGAVVNYHDYPWWYANGVGWLTLSWGVGSALVDTLSSGFFFLALFDLIAPGLSTSVGPGGIWLYLIGFFFSVCFYLLAQMGMFMGSGHYESKAAARADKMHGPQARVAVHSSVNEFFTRYRVWIVLASMVYMFTTDFIGFFKLEWVNLTSPGGVLSPAVRFLFATVINAGFSAVLFFCALNLVLYGAQMVDYAKTEKIADNRLHLTSDMAAGLKPGMSQQTPPKQAQVGTGGGQAKALPSGNQPPAKKPEEHVTVKMPQTGRLGEW